jgi:hypothetical protein
MKDDIEQLSADEQLALAIRIIKRQMTNKLEPEQLADIIEAGQDTLDELAERAKAARKGKPKETKAANGHAVAG